MFGITYPADGLAIDFDDDETVNDSRSHDDVGAYNYDYSSFNYPQSPTNHYPRPIQLPGSFSLFATAP